jgi:16S rRNA (guanine527-N7)-methyltransferase
VPRTDDHGDSPVASESLELVLAEARQLGFLGPGPLELQLRHALGFVAVARPLFVTTTPHLVDMGAGGGLPGLVVAQHWPEVSLVLLEANERRSAFLRRALNQLELGDRASVLQERAEVCGRDPAWRATFDGAIARSFGRPAVLAECTAPLLKSGAWIVVSEPPTTTKLSTAQSESALEAGTPVEASAVETEPATPRTAEPGRFVPGPPELGNSGPDPGATLSAERWPARGLRQFGLEPGQLLHAEFDYQLLRQVEACPERFPRRNGVPAKKPLF